MQSRVVELLDDLSGAQRQVAELLLRNPEAIAFGTTEGVAAEVGVSGPTVVRFAATLGFAGYADLRDRVRDELSDRLRSASARVRQRPDDDLLDRVLDIERRNVERTIAGLDPVAVDLAVNLLADRERRVWVLPSSQFEGLGRRLVDELSMCRGRPRLLVGSEFRVRTELAAASPGDVLVTLDVQRHEAWLVRTQHTAVAAGLVPVALTDRLPCSLALDDGHALTFSCDTATPFASQVGALVVVNALVAGLVERMRPELVDRIDHLEGLWSDGLFEY